ncbi:probable asparagine synthetase [glutamine-hydrolyzing] [Phlebotomus argentipes]|uniref:probable asparagine synthetase [glutamine-hydrolyzing] n=1 Tax=Phlebotomus argentipes TaxID=94469 RepID=UPI00289374F5|nr:probable asparagine synthetase [glutamine-hydrolyzing] [Phlebotomus argentipes]
MCGIFAVFSRTGTVKLPRSASGRKESLREFVYRQSGCQRHRGPDHTGVVLVPEHGVAIVQERLALLGIRTGAQPMKSSTGEVILAANGEIYNYLEIAKEISRRRKTSYVPRSDSDVIIGLYEDFGRSLLHQITGMFTFVLYDRTKKSILIARDPIGIIPLYLGKDEEGNLWVASEMKCLVGVCRDVKAFPPGTLCHGTPDRLVFEQFYTPKWITTIPTHQSNLTLLRKKLENAVRSHLQCDVPFGALLSGGVDSSLIASIATKIMRERDPNFRLKTYSVGLRGAPDFKYSRMVADYINSDHTEVYFTIEDGLDCIPDIIRHLESYDITTIRASIPMYLLSRFIKSEGLKMVLSGEGADEIFGGYLYFHRAPNARDFHEETVTRVRCLHLADCLRANKSTMAWGLELRVPFLDTEFVNFAMNIRPEDRMPAATDQMISRKTLENGKPVENPKIEKYILRAAFRDNYLPHEVLWRQKEQFSDGVGYQWIDTIKSFSAAHVDDQELENAEEIFPINTPVTKEAFFYRQIFQEIFPAESFAHTVMKWVPRTDWGCSADPSGRAQAVHIAAHA